jgi:hypothetical protein
MDRSEAHDHIVGNPTDALRNCVILVAIWLVEV